MQLIKTRTLSALLNQPNVTGWAQSIPGLMLGSGKKYRSLVPNMTKLKHKNSDRGSDFLREKQASKLIHMSF